MRNMTSNEQQSQYQVIQTAMLEKRFKDAETMSIDRLKAEPLNAQCWVFLGEALMLQGYKETAMKVFDRAWLLDPQATWVTSIFPLLNKLKDDMPRLDIEMMMELPHVTVSASMIVKNEERCIARCLDSLSEAVDEIVIVDTGSTDATLAIIQRYPKVKVYKYEWDDDFGRAKNESLKYVTSDWTICVDADEHLMKEDVACIREAAKLFSQSSRPAILNVGRLNAIEGSVQLNYNESRMFPSNKGIHYQGLAHPRVGGENDKADGELIRTPIRIRFHHDGYEPHIYKSRGKAELRLRQLEKMVDDQPDEPRWWLLYGREVLQQGEVSRALELLQKAESLAEVSPSFGRMVEIQMLLAGIYMNQGLLESVEAVCNKALAIHPDYPDAHYLCARLEEMRANKLINEARSLLEQAKHNTSSYRGNVEADVEIGQWKANQVLAEAAKLSGNYEDAEVLLNRIKQFKLVRGGA